MARVGFIVGDMFEESELEKPLEAVKKAGHEAVMIGAKKGQQVTGKAGVKTVRCDVGIMEIEAKALDALVIPGGYSPDHLRSNQAMVTLVRVIAESVKPVAAICHGPSIFVDAGILEGRTVTSFESIKADLINAGATWVDRETCVDDNLLTSRSPDDLPAFCEKLTGMLKERVGNEPKQRRARIGGETTVER